MVKTRVNKSLHGVAAAALLILAGLEPISANDSAAELSIGGLRLVQSNTIALETEDLRISLDRVSVRYQFANTSGKPVTLTLAGDGEEMDALKSQVQRLGLAETVRFIGHVKARYGFSKGGLLAVPSRGDSMPYVVIEAAAAGIPMVAANVGGIPEIFDSQTEALFAPNIAAAMADAIEMALEDPAAALERAKSLRERIFLHFSQKAMVEGVLAGYRDAFANR